MRLCTISSIFSDGCSLQQRSAASAVCTTIGMKTSHIDISIENLAAPEGEPVSSFCRVTVPSWHWLLYLWHGSSWACRWIAVYVSAHTYLASYTRAFCISETLFPAPTLHAAAQHSIDEGRNSLSAEFPRALLIVIGRARKYVSNTLSPVTTLHSKGWKVECTSY